MVPGAVVVATVEVVPAGVVVTEERNLAAMKLCSSIAAFKLVLWREQEALGVT